MINDEDQLTYTIENLISISRIEYEATDACFSAFSDEWDKAMDTLTPEEQVIAVGLRDSIQKDVFDGLNI